MNARKKPLVIEFTGTPNSGKTSAIHATKAYLEELGYKVKIFQENAEVVPKEIPKKTWERNMWIAAGQLQSLIEAKYFDGDVVLLDRGFWDALCWIDILVSQHICNVEQAEIAVSFIADEALSMNIIPDFLFVMDVSTPESLKRRMLQENAEKPVLSNESFIANYKVCMSYFFNNSLDVLCKVTSEDYVDSHKKDLVKTLKIGERVMFYFETTPYVKSKMEEVVAKNIASLVDMYR